MVNKWWLELKNKYKNIKLDEFIIMPNHIHGIIILKNEHIIRNENDLNQIRQYINNNPFKGVEDEDDPWPIIKP